MRIAVLGAGVMGAAAARLLARHEVDLLVLDADAERAERAAAGLDRVEIGSAAIGSEELPKALAGLDAVAACIPYRLNLEAMDAAFAAGVPYADLGGLFHMTLRQLELDDRYREAGLAAVMGIGCCPGISNVLARLTADRLEEVRSIDILDGAVEDNGGFSVPYSADTILDEFSKPAVIFEDGQLKEVPAASGTIRYRFPEPLGEMEAFYTLHSEPATLPRTIPDVRDVRWRLALPPKIAEGFRLLVEVGLASEEPVDTPSGRAVPRDLLRTLLSRLSPTPGPARDIEVLVVRATGTLEGRPATVVAEATFEPQPEGIGGGVFGTAMPMAVAARWLAEGRVPPGVHPPETALPAEAFVEELQGEGMKLRVAVEGNPG